MSCKDCTEAESKSWHGFSARCRGCHIRSLATCLPFFQSQQCSQITPAYRAALQKLFGDSWQEGHTEVKAEKQRIAGRAATKIMQKELQSC